MQPVRPACAGVGTAGREHGVQRVAPGQQAVQQQWGRSQHGRRSEQRPGGTPQLPAAEPEKDRAGRRDVRQHERVDPEHQPGQEPPRGPARQPPAGSPGVGRPRIGSPSVGRSPPRSTGGQIHGEQGQRCPGRVHLGVAAAGDQLVLDDPVGTEGQQRHHQQPEPPVPGQPQRQPPGQQQEQRVQDQRGQPQPEQRRPTGEGEHRRGQVRLQRAHVLLTVEPDREALTPGDVQRGQPHGGLVAVRRRGGVQQQPEPVTHPGEHCQPGEPTDQAGTCAGSRAGRVGAARLLAYADGHHRIMTPGRRTAVRRCRRSQPAVATEAAARASMACL
ncbi:hypothetical protein ONO86_03550 [Micromonospora noduli]|nr:hypothetical protein ONO86_03550 [Micromonospora noduli]